jgi:Leucine-rich repeat (LRR) protein
MYARLLTLTALVLAAPAAFADESEDRAVEAVTKLGGEIIRNDKDPDRPVVKVYLSDTQVTDAELKVLSALKKLQTLDLGGTKVTDAGCKELTALKSLRDLALDGTQVTDVGLKELTALKGLVSLYLNKTQVTDAGLKELATLKDLQALSRSAKVF